MKLFGVALIVLSGLLLLNVYLGYCQVSTPAAPQEVKTVDIDKDGDADVTYHKSGEYVSKIEADTNNDGKNDVTVNVKDGQFESAEVDTDYDGTPDKTFNNAADFSSWVNQEKPDFDPLLDKEDWRWSKLF